MPKAKNELEPQLMKMWGDLLGIQVKSIDDDFFNLGGDSLQLIELVVRLNKHYGVDFDLDRFFYEPNIRTLITVLKDAGLN